MIGEKGTRERILESASSLFLERGYEGVGLREIAMRADVTTGAFYRHFKGKRELFTALVGDVYQHIIEMYQETLDGFFKLPASEQAERMSSWTHEAVDRMTDYMYEHLDEMRLILKSSKGSGYRELSKVLAEMDEKATDEFAEGSRNAGVAVNEVHETLERILTEGMFSAFLDLIGREMPREEMKICSDSLLDFYEAGWWKIMGI